MVLFSQHIKLCDDIFYIHRKWIIYFHKQIYPENYFQEPFKRKQFRVQKNEDNPFVINLREEKKNVQEEPVTQEKGKKGAKSKPK